MSFTRSLARKAFAANDIVTIRELRASGVQLTQEHLDAINAVCQDYPSFCSFIAGELNRWPLTQEYFSHLVQARLKQEAVLASGFIARLIDDANPTEERLARLHGKVINLQCITQDVHAPNGIDRYADSDELLLDLWNEFFVLDFLINRPSFSFAKAEKVVRGRGQPQIDVTAEIGDQRYAIEITRIRKRDFTGSTIPNQFDAIYQPENLNSLRSALRNKLHDKNTQIRNFVNGEPSTYDRRLLVLKTSQWEYQDGSTIVRDETQLLLDSGRFDSIDEVLLIYDTENYDWLR